MNRFHTLSAALFGAAGFGASVASGAPAPFAAFAGGVLGGALANIASDGCKMAGEQFRLFNDPDAPSRNHDLANLAGHAIRLIVRSAAREFGRKRPGSSEIRAAAGIDASVYADLLGREEFAEISIEALSEFIGRPHGGLQDRAVRQSIWFALLAKALRDTDGDASQDFEGERARGLLFAAQRLWENFPAQFNGLLRDDPKANGRAWIAFQNRMLRRMVDIAEAMHGDVREHRAEWRAFADDMERMVGDLESRLAEDAPLHKDVRRTKNLAGSTYSEVQCLGGLMESAMEKLSSLVEAQQGGLAGLSSPPATRYPHGNYHATAPAASPQLVHRAALAERVHAWIEEEGDPRSLCLVGHAGSGKTEFARSIARDFADNARTGRGPFDTVWWVDADPESSRDWLVVLATRLGLRDVETRPERELADDVALALSDGRKHLVVLDNADDPAIVDIVPGGSVCRVLITSRTREWPRQQVRTLEIEGLTNEESYALLRFFRDDLTPDELGSVAEAAGRHPLALTACGSWLARASRPTVEDLLARLAVPPIDGVHPLLSESVLRSATRYERPVLAALATAFESLTRPDDIRIVRLCSLLGPDVIPVGLLAAATGETPEHVIDVIDRLHAAGVGRAIPTTDWAGDQVGFCVHRLVQESIRVRLRERGADEIGPLIHGLEDGFWNVLTELDLGTAASESIALHSAAFLEHVDAESDKHVAEFQSVTRDANLMLVHAIGSVQLIGNITSASLIARAERAHRMLDSLEAPDVNYRFVVELMHGLAALLVGDYEIAEQELGSALDFMIDELAGPQNCEDIACAFGFRALLGMLRGDYPRARASIEEAIRRGAESPDVQEETRSGFLYYRSLIALATGNLEEAERDVRAVLQYAEARGNDDTIKAARIPLAGILRRKSDHEGALTIFQECLDSASSQARDDGQSEAVMHSIVARVLAEMGRTDEALDHADQALAILTAPPMKNPLMLGQAHCSRAFAFLVRDQVSDGLAEIDRSLECLSAQGRAEDPTSMDARMIRSRLLMRAVRFSDAQTELERMIAWYEEHAPDAIPDFPAALSCLGQVLRDQGDLNAALAQSSRAVSLFERSPNPTILSVQATFVRASIFSGLGAHAQAESDATRVVQAIESGAPCLPADHAAAEIVLARCRIVAGDDSSACSILDAAIDRLRTLAVRSPDEARALCLRGGIQHRAGNLTAAVDDTTTAIDLWLTFAQYNTIELHNMIDQRVGTLFAMVQNGAFDRRPELISDLEKLISLAEPCSLQAGHVVTLYSNLASQLIAASEFERAIAVLNEAIMKFDPPNDNSTDLIALRAIARLRSGNPASALDDATAARGWFAQRLGATDPKHLHACVVRAEALLALQHYDAAQEDLAIAVPSLRRVSAPHLLAQALDLRSRIRAAQGHPDEARADLDEALSICEQHGQGASTLAQELRSRADEA